MSLDSIDMALVTKMVPLVVQGIASIGQASISSATRGIEIDALKRDRNRAVFEERRQTERLLAKRRADIGASGTTFSGTNLEILLEEARNRELGTGILKEGFNRQIAAAEQAQFNAKAQGIFGVAGALAGAGGVLTQFFQNRPGRISVAKNLPTTRSGGLTQLP